MLFSFVLLGLFCFNCLSSPIAIWEFNRPNFKTDSSGNGNDLTIPSAGLGQVDFYREGDPQNAALTANFPAQFASSTSTFSVSPSFTFQCLFQTRTLTTVVYPFFLSRLNTFASRSLAIEISAVGSLKVYSSTTSIISTPANTIQNGQAYHILFIFQAPNIISLYLNGNLYVTKNNNAFKNLFNTPQYAAFGYRFTGFIDMVRFDDTAFTPAEASNAFQSLGWCGAGLCPGSCYVNSVSNENCPISNGDRAVLAELYAATGGSNWKFPKWDLTQDLCKGFNFDANNQIKCNPAGRVTNLALVSRDLEGTIPDSIGNLKELLTLNLRSNTLKSSIPITLRELTKLTELNLSQNKLTGSIHVGLAKLPDLTIFSLCCNQLTGNFPHWLNYYKNATTISLEWNQLTGSVPNIFTPLTQLDYLGIYHNQLTGTLPASMSKLASVTYFGIAYNGFTGTFPTWIPNLTNLVHLSLEGNKFTGTIPSSISDLTNLQIFRLTTNKVTGEIPDSIGSLPNLLNLELANNRLTGTVPDSLRTNPGLKRGGSTLYLKQNLFSCPLVNYSTWAKTTDRSLASCTP